MPFQDRTDQSLFAENSLERRTATQGVTRASTLFCFNAGATSAKLGQLWTNVRPADRVSCEYHPIHLAKVIILSGTDTLFLHLPTPPPPSDTGHPILLRHGRGQHCLLGLRCNGRIGSACRCVFWKCITSLSFTFSLHVTNRPMYVVILWCKPTGLSQGIYKSFLYF